MKRFRLREPVNAVTHLGGALLALLGLVWLQWLTYGDTALMLVCLVYSISVIITLTTSGIMHLYMGDKHTIQFLIRLDHAAIYMMIAGSYTPIAYMLLPSPMRWMVLGAIWLVAFGGAAYKITSWRRDSIVSTILYMAMGWSVLLLLPIILPQIDTGGLVLFGLCGAMYSAGAIVFVFKRPNLNRWWGYHELWHMFVLAGCAFHFWAMTQYILLA